MPADTLALRVIETFAARAGVELERQQADEKLRRLNEENAALLNINRAIGRHLDRDEMFAAELGKGAFLNGQSIRVSATARLAECLVGTGFPSQKRHKSPNIYFYHQLTLRTHGVRRAGSAALDLCNVACGRFDGFWEFNLNPWDTAAGVLIAQEAGGRVTNFSGGPFQLDSRETLASNGLVHDALVHEFQEIFAGRGLEQLPSPVEYAKDRST